MNEQLTDKQRTKVSSSSAWENETGHSIVVKSTNAFEVAGTIAVDEDGDIVGPKNAYMQTKYIIEKN